MASAARSCAVRFADGTAPPATIHVVRVSLRRCLDPIAEESAGSHDYDDDVP
uniref:Uncharacterized protein n=1 Tax=Arundo donax TaxID=35708 RepID=A0A0A8Z561_ARUDO